MLDCFLFKFTVQHSLAVAYISLMSGFILIIFVLLMAVSIMILPQANQSTCL